jgi:hypothetical protein
MTLTSKGEKIEANMQREYGSSKNADTIAGVDKTIVGRVDTNIIGGFNQMTGAYVSGGKKE